MSRDVQDDETDDVEMRECLGRVGCEEVVLMVVVVVLEEEPLRSDTRLPQESSPYMAGNFLHVDLAAGQVDFLQRNRQRSLCSSSSSQSWSSIIFFPSVTSTESHAFPVWQVFLTRHKAKETIEAGDLKEDANEEQTDQQLWKG